MQKFNPNDATSLRDSLLTVASNNWKMDEKDILENMRKIAFVESQNTLDATQILNDGSEGKGKGLYQYETGYRGGAHTGINRLINMFGNIPTFLDGIIDKNYDISGLSKEAQQSIFLADKLKGSMNLEGVDTNEKLAREWADNHLATTEDKKDERIKFFLNEMNVFK